MKIQVKYFVEGLQPVEKLQKGDWIDLRAAEDVTLQAPPGALTVENDGQRTEYGEYSYLKYWLPKGQLYRPQIRSGGRS